MFILSKIVYPYNFVSNWSFPFNIFTFNNVLSFDAVNGFLNSPIPTIAECSSFNNRFNVLLVILSISTSDLISDVTE